GCCSIQHGDFRGIQFNGTRGNIRVLAALWACFHFGGNLQHVLVAQMIELAFIMDHNLCDARGIAKVDKSYPTVVSAAGNPARHCNGLSDVLGVECAELMGAKHVVFPLLSSTYLIKTWWCSWSVYRQQCYLPV